MIWTRCLAILGAFLAASLTMGQPFQTVYIFNDDQTDANADNKSVSANQFAKSFIWQQLGLNDPSGKPGSIQPNGDIRNSAGAVVGKVLKDPTGNVIGYQNADGSKAAYDVNMYATYNAFNDVAVNGKFIVMKHGGGPNGTHGGSQHLDLGTSYDGVKPEGSSSTGTGAGSRNNRNRQPSGPYPLPPRPGANITVILFVCNGGTDPAGPATAVAGTWQQIPGVSSVQSWPHTLGGSIQWSYGEPLDPIKRRKAERRLREAAQAAGFFPQGGGEPTDQDVSNWMQTLDADTRFDQVNDIANGTPNDPDIKVNLSYKTSHTFTDGDILGAFTCPVLVSPGTALSVGLEEPRGDVRGWLHVEASDLDGHEMFQIEKVNPGAPPLGRWASGVFDFRELDVIRPTPGPLLYELEFYGNPSLVRPVVYDFDTDVYVPVEPYTVVGNRIQFELRGARKVGLVESVSNVIVDAVRPRKGRIIELNVWAPQSRSLMDIHLGSLGISVAFELNTSEIEMDLTASGPGALLDVRGQARCSDASGSLVSVQFKNRATGVFETVGSLTALSGNTEFNFMNIAASNYLDADRKLVMRLRSKIDRPIVVSEFLTDFPVFEVVAH